MTIPTNSPVSLQVEHPLLPLKFFIWVRSALANRSAVSSMSIPLQVTTSSLSSILIPNYRNMNNKTRFEMCSNDLSGRKDCCSKKVIVI